MSSKSGIDKVLLFLLMKRIIWTRNSGFSIVHAILDVYSTPHDVFSPSYNFFVIIKMNRLRRTACLTKHYGKNIRKQQISIRNQCEVVDNTDMEGQSANFLLSKL